MLLKNPNKVSWEEFDSLAKDIYNQVLASNTCFDSIIGIARGGLFLSSYLAYQLSIKKLYVINTQLYSDKKLITPHILYYPENIKLNNVLVVDDILDTGSTYHLLYDLLSSISSRFSWAVLIDKAKSNIQADFTGITLSQDVWVEFPWNKS